MMAQKGIVLAVLLALSACSSQTPGREPGPAPSVFRIEPLVPVEELKRRALDAVPPVEEGEFREPELVNLAAFDPTLQFDIRYASSRNFMGAPFYSFPRAYLQRPAAEALLAAHRGLAKRGLGLLIYDAYRPWYVTRMFWEGTPEELRRQGFVADPARGSRHNRGAAVDLTLYRLETGAPLPMPSGYDEFTERAHANYPGGTEQERLNRGLLIETMKEHGFAVLEEEWWHYDYSKWREYPILNLTFEELDQAAVEP